MRDLLVFGVVLWTLPLSWRRPFFGLLLFSWLAYMRPQDLCWGFARNMRFSFYVGITMIAGWYANERGRRPFAIWELRTRLLLMLTVLVSISFALARYHDAFMAVYFVEFLKIMLVALFTTGQVSDQKRLRWLVWTIALCLGFFGIKGGLLGLARGGMPILRGPGGMMEDNNDFALAMVMNLPLLWYLGLNERHRPYVRKATIAGVALTVITIVLTHSRGSFVAMCCCALWIAWRSRRLVSATAVLGLCTATFFAFAPQHVIDRIASIGQGTAEHSAAARVFAWKTAMTMIENNPIWGVGLRNFQPRFLEYAKIDQSTGITTYVAHNSYLQIWAEGGSLAFICYLILLLSVFFTCARVYRMGQLRPDMAWALDYARMMEATTVAFMVGSVFLNRGHFDLVYHWLALVTCLGTVATACYLRRPTAAVTTAVGGHGGAVSVRLRPLPAGGPVRRWGRGP